MAVQSIKLSKNDGKGGVIEAVQKDGKYYDASSGKALKDISNGRTAAQWAVDESSPVGMNLKEMMELENVKAQNEAKRVEQARKDGYNANGRPIRPDFESQLDPATGLLQNKYQLTARPDVQVDQRAIDAIRNRGLAQGPSDWAKASLDKQALEQSGALDQARQQSAGAQAQTLANLMMRGGLSGGSRERLAGRGARDQMLAAQGVYRQGQLDRANIGVQDEQFKNQALKDTAGFDFQNANVAAQNRQYQTDVQGKNLSAALSEIQNKRAYDSEGYQERMKSWAAEQQSKAMAGASGGGKK